MEVTGELKHAYQSHGYNKILKDLDHLHISRSTTDRLEDLIRTVRFSMQGGGAMVRS